MWKLKLSRYLLLLHILEKLINTNIYNKIIFLKPLQSLDLLTSFKILTIVIVCA